MLSISAVEKLPTTLFLDNRARSATWQEFARNLEAFARMYEHHAAIEDTIIFPAWKQTMTKDQTGRH